MIANWSRLSQFAECRQKAWNWDELKLTSWRTPDALWQGGGFHVGVAELFATKNTHSSVQAAEDEIRGRLVKEIILPEERPLIEQRIEWTKRAVAKFAEYYAEEDIEVLWPEVSFNVPMPNSSHHCFFMHRLLHPDDSTNGCNDSRCWMPHYFRGRTDAVVQWMTKIWLFEHKTNSMSNDIFFKKYLLDAQPTGYMYGIWKSLGVKPEGFILNVIQKPYKTAKDQLSVGFSREPYFRTTEDLERFEREFIAQANDYERAFAAGASGDLSQVYMNTRSCSNWGRMCIYADKCQRGHTFEGEFAHRVGDYVEAEYYKLAGLEVPEEPTEEENTTDVV